MAGYRAPHDEAKEYRNEDGSDAEGSST